MGAIATSFGSIISTIKGIGQALNAKGYPVMSYAPAKWPDIIGGYEGMTAAQIAAISTHASEDDTTPIHTGKSADMNLAYYLQDNDLQPTALSFDGGDVDLTRIQNLNSDSATAAEDRAGANLETVNISNADIEGDFDSFLPSVDIQNLTMKDCDCSDSNFEIEGTDGDKFSNIDISGCTFENLEVKGTGVTTLDLTDNTITGDQTITYNDNLTDLSVTTTEDGTLTVGQNDSLQNLSITCNGGTASVDQPTGVLEVKLGTKGPTVINVSYTNDGDMVEFRDNGTAMIYAASTVIKPGLPKGTVEKVRRWANTGFTQFYNAKRATAINAAIYDKADKVKRQMGKEGYTLDAEEHGTTTVTRKYDILAFTWWYGDFSRISPGTERITYTYDGQVWKVEYV